MTTGVGSTNSAGQGSPLTPAQNQTPPLTARIAQIARALFPPINPSSSTSKPPQATNDRLVKIICFEDIHRHIHSTIKFKKVKALIQNGTNVNLPDKKGKYPLHCATIECRVDIMKLLLDNNANVNQPDIDGYCPLHYAAKIGNSDLIQLLLEYKPDINAPNEEGNRPIHLAIKCNRLNNVKLLLKHKADVNLANKEGDRPINLVIFREDLEILKLLIEHKADLNLVDKNGDRPIHLAIRHKRLDVVKLLLDGKADVNLVDKNGDRPIHLAVRSNLLDIVKILLENKAEANLTDEKGYYPINWAIRNRQIEMVKLLLSLANGLNLEPSDLSPLADDVDIQKIVKNRYGELFLKLMQVKDNQMSDLDALFISRGLLQSKEFDDLYLEHFDPFLSEIQKDKDFYWNISDSLRMNVNIPLTAEAISTIKSLSKNEKLFVAIQGGSSLDQIVIAYKKPFLEMNIAEKLCFYGVFRDRSGLALARDVLNQYDPNEPITEELIAALKLIERLQIPGEHIRTLSSSDIEDKIGLILLTNLQLVLKNRTSSTLVTQCLQTLAQLDRFYTKETNLPAFVAAVEILADTSTLNSLDLPVIIEILRVLRVYRDYKALHEIEPFALLAKKIIESKNPQLLWELGLTLSQIPHEPFLKLAFNVVSMVTPDRKSTVEDNITFSTGSFDRFTYKPRFSKLEILNRIYDGLSKGPTEEEYAKYRDHPLVKKYRDRLSITPMARLRNIEGTTVYLPKGSYLKRGIGSRKGNLLLNKAIIDLIEKGAGAADLTYADPHFATWAKVGQVFTAMSLDYVLGGYVSNQGALMVINSDFVNKEIRAGSVRNEGEGQSLNYVFYDGIPLDAMEWILLPRDLIDDIHLLRNVVSEIPTLKYFDSEDKTLLRLASSLRQRDEEFFKKLLPYDSVYDIRKLLDDKNIKETPFEAVVEENVKRYIGRILVREKLLGISIFSKSNL